MKEVGNITQAEVLEFASEERKLMGEPSPIGFHEFKGYEVGYSKNETYWHRYWLANSNILVFATYNGSEVHWKAEGSEVTQMLNSLKVNR